MIYCLCIYVNHMLMVDANFASKYSHLHVNQWITEFYDQFAYKQSLRPLGVLQTFWAKPTVSQSFEPNNQTAFSFLTHSSQLTTVFPHLTAQPNKPLDCLLFLNQNWSYMPLCNNHGRNKPNIDGTSRVNLLVRTKICLPNKKLFP